MGHRFSPGVARIKTKSTIRRNIELFFIISCKKRLKCWCCPVSWYSFHFATAIQVSGSSTGAMLQSVTRKLTTTAVYSRINGMKPTINYPDRTLITVQQHSSLWGIYFPTYLCIMKFPCTQRVRRSLTAEVNALVFCGGRLTRLTIFTLAFFFNVSFKWERTFLIISVAPKTLERTCINLLLNYFVKSESHSYTVI